MNADGWNAEHRVGTAVLVTSPHGYPVASLTSTAAADDPEAGCTVVGVIGFGVVTLDQVRPTPEADYQDAALVRCLQRWTTELGRPSAEWATRELGHHVTILPFDLIVRGEVMAAAAYITVTNSAGTFGMAISVRRVDCRSDVFSVQLSSRNLELLEGLAESALPGLVRR